MEQADLSVSMLPAAGAFRDGPIEDALFNYPKDIKFDNDGNMFVADYGNHCIRMISADNIVTTVAGQPGVAVQGRRTR